MKLRHITIIGGTLIGALWLVYTLFGGWVSSRLAARFESAILDATMGNATRAAPFVQNRLEEAAWLLAAGLLAVMLQAILAHILVKPGNRQNARWAFHSAAGFVLVNAWLAVAFHTMLGWCPWWQGKTETHNLTRFQIKARLLRECTTPVKAAILGNSQARAQLDEQLLNERLEPNLHIAELHFPGSDAYDILILHRGIDSRMAGVIVCYVSEMNFYCGSHSDIAALFFGFGDVADLKTLDVLKYIGRRKLGYGLLSDALPIFYLRDVIAQRILGLGVTGIGQRQQDLAATADLQANAAKSAPKFRINAESDFQKKAFANFSAECASRRQKLIVIAGQVNPLIGRLIDPAVRADMLAFLRTLRDQNSHVVLVDNAPDQEDSDYADLTHVTEAQQRAFTQFVAEQLKNTLPAWPEGRETSERR